MKILTLTKKIVSAFASKAFFVVTMVWFGLQAGWIALTGLYPQAFDEQYHFGLIKLHAQQWSPFFTSQPTSADQYGAITRDPSMLYHYLMSFVYRVIDIFTNNQTLQLILLRFVSVGLIIWAFVLFRRLLLMMGLGRAKTHVMLAFFSLLPVFPLLAGQLNYDNLLIPAVALTLIWSINLQASFEKLHHVDWLAALRLAIATLLFSTIKYAYVPILFAVWLYFIVLFRKSWRQIFSGVKTALLRLRRRQQAAYLVAFVAAIGLFGGGIGYNVIKYHEPNPSCSQVIAVERCREFGPFARDHDAYGRHIHPSAAKMAFYPINWVRNMMRESFFTVYSYFGSDGKPKYYGGQKVTQLSNMGWVWFFACLVGLIAGAKMLWKNSVTRIVLCISGIYMLGLFFVNWKSYYGLNYVVAIHGRYLLPVIIAFIGCAVLGISHLLQAATKSKRFVKYKQSVAVVAVLATFLLYTQGGGFGTYILYSGNGSFWHTSQLAKDANEKIRDVLQVVVLGR